MAEWRFGRGWSPVELEERLAALDELPTSFDEALEQDAPPPDGWSTSSSEALIAREAPGPPVRSGPFERARLAVERYEFSDPQVVDATLDLTGPLRGRRMLLELRVLGLRYLGGTVVSEVIDLEDERQRRFGFRYDTLRGHIERGAEWFILTKDLATGEVRFSIRSLWTVGDMPNWWSRLGFEVLAPLYRGRWLRHAHTRLQAAAHEGSPVMEGRRHAAT